MRGNRSDKKGLAASRSIEVDRGVHEVAGTFWREVAGASGAEGEGRPVRIGKSEGRSEDNTAEVHHGNARLGARFDGQRLTACRQFNFTNRPQNHALKVPRW